MRIRWDRTVPAFGQGSRTPTSVSGPPLLHIHRNGLAAGVLVEVSDAPASLANLAARLHVGRGRGYTALSGAGEVFVNGDSFIPEARALEPVFKARMFAGVRT